MFQFRIPQIIAFVLFATTLASFALSEDKPAPTTNPGATPVNIDVENEARNDAQVTYIVYFSAENFSDARAAQARLDASNSVVRAAKKRLSGDGGMREIVDGNLTDLARHLPGGIKEADRLMPLIQDGWHVLIITNTEQTEWSLPYVLNPYINIFEQIRFARRDDKNSNPRRYLAAPPRPSLPTPPPAPSPPAGAPQPK